jgi:alkanesulfonate monooxygenase SsuD/methylene tetrahydromethanopterin reductase-like flavin-dependent oxidoreductase (luciferase family)
MLKGNQMPLQHPVNDINNIYRKSGKFAVNQRLKYSFVGGPATVNKNLESFLKQTQVEEIMAISHKYNHVARLHSYEILSSL